MSIIGSIAGRIVLFLSLALLPVGLIAVMQTREVGAQLRQQSESSLAAFTDQAALPERQLIQRAFGAAEVLALIAKATRADPAACSAEFGRYVDMTGVYSAAGFLPTDRIVTCVSGGAPLDLSRARRLDEIMSDPRPNVELLVDAPISNHPVLAVRQPVFEGDAFLGYVFISVPHSTLSWAGVDEDAHPQVNLMTFNAKGDVLTSNGPDESIREMLPAGRLLADLAGSGRVTFTGTAANGERRAFAIVPIVPGAVYAIGSWPWQAHRIGMFPFAVPAWVFPLTMWLTSLAVAFGAMHRLVVRHVRSLQRAMRRFAADRRLPPPGRAATMPAELAEIYETFENMAETVLQDEAEMENAMHEKNVLLKEVHHRVKNNLQLISSIMNMQIRQLRSPEGRSVLRRLQERVLGLATIHRNLYQTENLSQVNADALLGEMINQIMVIGGSPASGIRVETEIAPAALYPDQAVPLSLLVTEAMTNALKYVGSPDGSAPFIRVRLRHDGPGILHFSITNTIAPEGGNAARHEGSGLGGNLINAFAMQLGSRAERVETETDYTLHVRFEAKEFDPADQPSVAAA